MGRSISLAFDFEGISRQIAKANDKADSHVTTLGLWHQAGRNAENGAFLRVDRNKWYLLA